MLFKISPPFSRDVEFDKCVESEAGGYIPKGSCECAKKLFPDFSHSYDWMDACDILNSRKLN